MGLIKKHYQKIIAYGLVAIGIVFLLFSFITRPQKTTAQETYNFNTESELTNISFPYSLEIPTTASNIEYIELYFGDDSINKYEYDISVSKGTDTLFEHTYVNEQSNIIRLPISEPSSSDGNILIDISCTGTCHNVKFELYNTKGGQVPRTVVVSHSLDYRYFWYAGFALIVGLTLIPVIKETK